MAVAVTLMATSPGPRGAKERSETVCRLSGDGMTAALKEDGTDMVVYGVSLKLEEGWKFSRAFRREERLSTLYITHWESLL